MRPSRGAAFAGLAFLLAVAPVAAQPAASRRAAEFDVVVERDVAIPMRDGVRLAADLYRPARDGKPADGPFPALLQRTPYSKGDGTSDEARYYAERGYVVILNDVRGRYASEGTWRLIEDDPADGFDTVEWIAAQPWSDGKVGTFGTSYPGGTQHALAEMNPPHLTTMVPVDALSNCGVAGMRHGGAFELRFMNWAFNQGASSSKAALANPALKAALDEQARRIREYVDRFPPRKGTTPLRLVPEYEDWLLKAIAAPADDPMWHVKGMSVVDHVADYADVPVLHVTGWYDSWTRQVCMNYEALSKAKKGPHRLLIGPWTHGGQRSNVAGEVEFTADAALDFDALRLRWYDHWMKGQAEGVDADAPVWIYVMGTGNDRRSPQGRLQHGGTWRAEKQWPLGRAVNISYYLHDDGVLRQVLPPGPSPVLSRTFFFDPENPAPTIGGNISSNANLMEAGGYDQRPRENTHPPGSTLPLSTRSDVLVYRTEPLPEDVEVTGTVTVTLYVNSNAPSTDFTAKLIDEIPPNQDYPLGFDLNIGDSIARIVTATGDPINTRLPITITLYPTSNVFKQGHRIRLDISSSNYPRFDVNPNTGEPSGASRGKLIAQNAVLSHRNSFPSRVDLPVILPAERGPAAGR